MPVLPEVLLPQPERPQSGRGPGQQAGSHKDQVLFYVGVWRKEDKERTELGQHYVYIIIGLHI